MGAWEKFDRLAAACVSKEIDFAAFVREGDAEFDRLARVVARQRRLPTWMDLGDVKAQLIQLAWHYLFERKCRNGAVGFDPARYRSAGAYCRWKVRHKIAKIISRAKGERQGDSVDENGNKLPARQGPGAPEYLSKTGELPDHGGDEAVEDRVERARSLDKIRAFCETARDFAMVSAMARGMGDDRRVVAFLLDAEVGFETPAQAYEALEEFVEEFPVRAGFVPPKRVRRRKPEAIAA